MLHRFSSSSSSPSTSSQQPSQQQPSQQQQQQATHFRNTNTPHPLYSKPVHVWENPVPHTVWSPAEVASIAQTHVQPRDTIDKLAYAGVRCVRFGFDVLSGYSFGAINETKLLRRIVFLETVAGIPGFVAGALRHLKSLRRMERDMGWIHTLLEEAENERMHLLCFLQLKRPSAFFRFNVLIAQGVMWNTFFLAYILSPRLCHRFVGYLEEEAVRTYTHAIEAVDDGRVEGWETMPAPDLAIQYWRMEPTATMRDVLLVVRADEANHRDVNHTLSGIPPDSINPFIHDHSSSGSGGGGGSGEK